MVTPERRRLPTVAFWVMAVTLIVLLARTTFLRATTPWSVLPDNDYWTNITGLITADGVKIELTSLFLHNNEHIVVIPKLIYAANYLIASGSNIGLIAYSVVMGGLCALTLLILAVRQFREMPIKLALCALLIPLAMFSSKLTHSYFLGMSGTIWLTADLLVILSAAALGRAITSNNSLWLIGSLAFALLGVLTYSTAIYSLIVLIVISVAFAIVPRFRCTMPAPVLVGVALAAAAALLLVIIYRNEPPYHPAWQFNPIELARFVLLYLGNALVEGEWCPVVGVAILAAGSYATYRLARDGRASEISTWIVLFLYAPFNGLMTGIGRLGLGSITALSSRYQSVTAISLIATFVLVLAALPRGAVSRRVAALRATTMLVLLLIAIDLLTTRDFVGPGDSAKRAQNHCRDRAAPWPARRSPPLPSGASGRGHRRPDPDAQGGTPRALRHRNRV